MSRTSLHCIATTMNKSSKRHIHNYLSITERLPSSISNIIASTTYGNLALHRIGNFGILRFRTVEMALFITGAITALRYKN